MAEQLPFKETVVGSIPTGRTKGVYSNLNSSSLFQPEADPPFEPEAHPSSGGGGKETVVGSIPTGRTKLIYMNKKKPVLTLVLIVLSVIILAVFAGVGFFVYNKKVQSEIVNQVGITAEECAKRSGEIVNILDDERAGDLEFRRDHKIDFCINKDDYLGDVVGLHCPCICCKKPTSSGFGHYQVEKAIMDYFLAQKYFSWKTTTDSRNFCVIENLNPTEDGLFPLYVWVRCGEFVAQNGELRELSGSSGPAKINYPNLLSYYDISKMSHEAPRDGSLYPKDIKTIFPLNVQNRIADFDSKNINSRIEAIAVDWLKTENSDKETCADLCGDGICQEFVCMAIGCPCSETPETCPSDCKQTGYIFDKSKFCPDYGDCNDYGVEPRKCSKIGDCAASCAFGCVSKKWMEGRVDCSAIWENFECECTEGICQRK